jgi:two-component system response regulator
MPERYVLLVEDDPNDEALTLRALRPLSLATPFLVVHDGAEAIQFLDGTGRYDGRDPAHVPALILLDLKMPKVGGLEVLRRIRQQTRTRWVPVVALTSSREHRDILASYELGANSYIRKPVSFSEFADAIRQVAIYWLEINQTPAPGIA